MNVLSSDKVTEAWLAYLENQSLSYVQEKTGLSFPTVKKLVEHGYARTKTRPFAEKLAEFTQALEKRVTEEALETPVQAVAGAIHELLLAREEFKRAFEQLAEMDYKRTKDPIAALVNLTNGCWLGVHSQRRYSNSPEQSQTTLLTRPATIRTMAPTLEIGPTKSLIIIASTASGRKGGRCRNDRP